MKKIFLAIVLMGLMLFSPVFAQYGLKEAVNETSIPQKAVTLIIGDILGTALSFISVLFFILMLYGGFLWMTARGNSDQEGKAKDTIIAAIIGVAIVLGAYAITKFVFDSVGGNSTTTNVSNSTASCNTEYVTYSCKNYKTCSKDVLKSDYETAVQDRNRSDLVEEKEGFAYIKNLCPGGNDNVCCL